MKHKAASLAAWRQTAKSIGFIGSTQCETLHWAGLQARRQPCSMQGFIESTTVAARIFLTVEGGLICPMSRVVS